MTEAPWLRTRIRVRGRVQGVGFRPAVWRLAHKLGVGGSVCNDAEGVLIEAVGSVKAIEALLEQLLLAAPPLARIDSIERLDSDTIPASTDGKTNSLSPFSTPFRILASPADKNSPPLTMIGPDTAPCLECLAEMFDPTSRRWRYAFTTCTHCGPRYTLTHALPYDRERTSMAPFPLCTQCQEEYDSPHDRRFHAETLACPTCGPQLALWESDPHGFNLHQKTSDPITVALKKLQAGQIVAIKGLGGWQLACDANNPKAIIRLRERKQRPEKPLAVMVLNTASAQLHVRMSSSTQQLLESSVAPIVLAPRLTSCSVPPCLPSEIAPHLNEIGLMRPSSPLHWLLWHEALGHPTGVAWTEQETPFALVMTSANPGGEPLVIRNDEAVSRLHGQADTLLGHNRSIVVRADDSVIRRSRLLRRARGYVPEPVELKKNGPNVLAMGGYLKNTVCFTRGNQAFVSQHIGDLKNAATLAYQNEVIEHLSSVLAVRPEIIVCDQHPDDPSARRARYWSERWGAELMTVQHHHAHLAAVLAEHENHHPTTSWQRLIGLALDGSGYGSDGQMWGGECLELFCHQSDKAQVRRLGHLYPLPLPGGDRAAREPWRMTCAWLHAVGRGDEIQAYFPEQPGARIVGDMLDRSLNCPPSSSAGRWFDAAAGLLGICAHQHYEGQAASQMEALASEIKHDCACQSYAITDGVLSLLPLLPELESRMRHNRAEAAACFHDTMAYALGHWLEDRSKASHYKSEEVTVLLGGGCFHNQRLSQRLRQALKKRPLTQNWQVLEAREFPAGDGGLSLGQAWIARQTASG